MITNIKIENFRQFDNLEINNLKQFNVLVGYSNVGKTSILEAIWANTAPENINSLLVLDKFRGSFSNSNAFLKLFRDLSFENSIKITCNIDDGYASEFTIKKNSAITISEGNDKNFIPHIELRGTHKAFTTNKETTENTFMYQFNEDGTAMKFIPISINDFEVHNVTFLSDITFSNSSLLKNVNILLEDDNKKKQFLDYVNFFDDYEIENFHINDKNNVAIKFKNSNVYIPFTLQGQGFKKYFDIILAIVIKETNCLLIDELEAGLHHSLFTYLLKTIIKLSKDKDIQIVCTTHSKEILTTLNEIMQEEEMGDYRDTLNIIRIANTKKGYKSYNINKDELEDAVETNWDLRDA